MLAEHLRDAAATAAVFGFFAPSRFGWAQEAPPPAWRKPLIAATAGSVLVCLVGALLAGARGTTAQCCSPGHSSPSPWPPWEAEAPQGSRRRAWTGRWSLGNWVPCRWVFISVASAVTSGVVRIQSSRSPPGTRGW